MNIVRASHLGMCFGVRDAIDLAFDQSQHGPLTVLGELVHNQSVLTSLRDRGIEIQNDPEAVRSESVMVTAHGTSERNLEALRARGLNVLEATCPLVHVAHQAVKKLVREGYHPIVIGKGDHVEVRGLTGDLEAFDVILTEEEVDQLAERQRFGMVAQTTQPLTRVRRLVELMRRRFPKSEIRFVDTVCQPTKQRQNAAVELAQQADVVIVIGGANSNNTHELVTTSRRYCERVHHIQHAGQIVPEWLEDANTVGITAGTSTPDSIIDAIESRLKALAAKSALVPSV